MCFCRADKFTNNATSDMIIQVILQKEICLEMKERQKGNFILLLTAMVWGMGFVAQKAGAALEPFTYNGIRMVLAGIFLIPVIFAIRRKRSRDGGVDKNVSVITSVKGGMCCGVVLCFGANLQQFGIYFQTDAGKAGFITALYILIVPILCIFLKKKVSVISWICVFLGIAGFYCLTMAGKGQGGHLSFGDFFVLLCAIAFAVHIVVVDHYTETCDGVILAATQFFTAGCISLILMLVFESPDIGMIKTLWLPIVYGGLFSCGIGYTLQVIGQQYANPTTGSMIMSLESVFSVVFGVLLLGERMTLIEMIGCAIIFVAVMLPQVVEILGDNK